MLVVPSSVVFSVLRVTAAVTDSTYWWVIHAEPDVSAFELEHGADPERGQYNARHFEQVRRTGKPVRGRHAGYSDLFVPVTAGDEVEAILVTGPFAERRPTSASVLDGWRRLTGRQGHPADPEFAAYLSAALSTLVLDAGNSAKLEELLGCLARLMAGEGRADALANRAEALHVELRQVRAVERVWDAVQAMVDDRFPRTWSSISRRDDLRDIGLSRPPDQILVGLTTRRSPGLDPVDEAFLRDALQRRSVELGRAVGDVISGRVGDHGVVFLSAASGSASKRRRKLVELAERASKLARDRFGLSVHLGASEAPGAVSLSRSYQAALGAAESALARGTKLVFADDGETGPGSPLARLRRELGTVEERPDLLRGRFDRYLEAVAVHCAYRIDPARAHLEVGFERMAEALANRGAFDEKSMGAMRDGLDRAAAAARTVDELFGAYRRAAADVVDAVQRPVPSRRDRSLRRAIDYIHQHYTEALRLEGVARVAGFAPRHFSKLFILRERMPFVDYVARLRLERAKQLLIGTDLDATRVADLCGWRSSQYFCRVFRRAMGVTPLGYRRATPRPADRTVGRNTHQNVPKYKARGGGSR
jgi:AraC-like DNA-binding protein